MKKQKRCLCVIDTADTAALKDRIDGLFTLVSKAKKEKPQTLLRSIRKGQISKAEDVYTGTLFTLWAMYGWDSLRAARLKGIFRTPGHKPIIDLLRELTDACESALQHVKKDLTRGVVPKGYLG